MLGNRVAQPTRQLGVSLVEIVVVLAIIGIGVMAVLPDVTSIIGNARIRSSAETFLAGLARTRVEAIRLNRPVTFWMVSPNADRALDDTCESSNVSASWVVSINDPALKCALAVSTNPDDTTDPVLIQAKHNGGEASLTLDVKGLAADLSTAASAVRFDGFGRIAGGDLRFVNFNSTSPSNDLRPLRIEMTNSGVVRLCEPRITATDDPRRCLFS
jgi:type IV fimbrial biogenesis protein FimT